MAMGSAGSSGRVPASPDHLDALDLLDPQLHALYDLGPVFRRMRREAPVWRQPAVDGRPGFRVLSRHADVQRLLRDTVSLTSVHGNMLGTLLRGGDAASEQMLVVTDGTWHAALRRVLAGGFGPRTLDAIATAITAATRQGLLRALDRGVCDFVADVAATVPLTAICELLGVPAADRPRVLSLTSEAMQGDIAEKSGLEARIAQNEILLYYSQLAAERRDSPGDDVISLLTSCEVEGRPLTEQEVLLNCYNLVIGGDETSRLAMAGGLLALSERPDQWEMLQGNPSLVDSAVEEILRWTAPAIHVARTARKSFSLHGQTIEAGEIVTLWIASANRDETVFAEPELFDVTRTPNRHLTFGYGQHFCLGAHLARLELRSMLTEMLRHVAVVVPAGPVEWLPSGFLNGISRLPLSMSPRR